MSQFNTSGYDIERPTGVCTFTGRKLEPGEHYIAALVEFDTDAAPAPAAGPAISVSASKAGEAAITAGPATASPGAAPAPAPEKPSPGQAGEKKTQQPVKSGSKLGFKRIDVSMEAWKEGKRPDRIFSYWKSTVAHPNQKKKVFVDDEVLMALLKRLADDPQPQRQAFRFVLALILMRKKQLRFEGQTEKTVEVPDGQGGVTRKVQEWWDMLPKGEDSPIPVLNPQLDDAQIREVTEQLGEVLEGQV